MPSPTSSLQVTLPNQAQASGESGDSNASPVDRASDSTQIAHAEPSVAQLQDEIDKIATRLQETDVKRNPILIVELSKNLGELAIQLEEKQKREPAISKILKAGPDTVQTLLRRRQAKPMELGSPTSRNRSYSNPEVKDPDLSTLIDMPPSQEVLVTRVARSGSVREPSGDTPKTPLSSSTSSSATRGSELAYENKLRELADAGLVGDFQELKLERDFVDESRPTLRSKIFLGAGTTSEVYAVRLEHSYIDYGQEFVFKQLFDMKRLPVYAEASMLAMKDLSPEDAEKKVIEQAKRKIVQEFRFNAYVGDIPQVAKVYGFFNLEGTLGILQEKVDGPNLRYLHMDGRIAVAHRVITEKDFLDVVLRAIADILIVLAGMHDRNQIHGDIKPDNIRWSKQENMHKTLDYGASRIFGEKKGAHTPGYGEIDATPSRHLSFASPLDDIYQSGQTLHFLLTGLTAGRKKYTDGKSIPFAPAFDAIGDDVKNQLAELLNGMISPQHEGEDIRKKAKDLLDMPLFQKMESREKIGEIYDRLEAWSENKPQKT
jgi:serine/threonine protein kinase